MSKYICDPRDLERLNNFRLLDDDFMSIVFQDSPEAVEYVIRTIFDDQRIKVLAVATQYEMKNLAGGRSIKLDVKAIDAQGCLFNVEIQRADQGAGKKRARYYSSMLDSTTLHANEPFSALPETYVIFITENDVLGNGLPLYHVERVIQETGDLFDDGEHIIYMNGAYVGEDPVGVLARDFRAKAPEEMKKSVLEERVRYFKRSEEGQTAMCRMMEEMRNEAAAAAAVLAAEKNTVENYYAMRSLNVPEDILRRGLGITDDVLAKYPELAPKQ